MTTPERWTSLLKLRGRIWKPVVRPLRRDELAGLKSKTVHNAAGSVRLADLEREGAGPVSVVRGMLGDAPGLGVRIVGLSLLTRAYPCPMVE